jgi:hypothetical protein
MPTNKELEARLEELSRENEQMRELVQDALVQREAHAAAGNDTSPAVDLLYDPYDSHNPLHISGDIAPSEKFPEGQKLSWKSERIRQHKGWKGWIPVRWDDEFGQNLGEYLSDAPMRMEGSENLDGYVRRGGLVLCRLDARIWNSRSAKRELKDRQQRGHDLVPTNQPLYGRPGVHLTGDGMTQDQSPRGRGGVQNPDTYRSELTPDRRHLSDEMPQPEDNEG